MGLGGLLLALALAVVEIALINSGSLVIFAALAFTILALQYTGVLFGLGLGLAYFALSASLLLAFIKPLRRRLISKPAFKILKKSLPKVSQTEQEALDAGNTWWEANLFRGNPNWEQFSEIKLPDLTEEERSFLDNETNELCKMLDEWEITNDLKDLPEEAWEYMKTKGFFSFIIPKEFGGKGFSPAANSAIVHKIAGRSLTAAVTVMVPNSLGPGELLMHYGTKEQQEYYLPRLASGKDVPCFALTSPLAGSDATSLVDTGVVCKGTFEGKECVGIRLNWDKRYITLSPVATVLGLAFKMSDPDGLIGDKKDLGISVCLLPTNLPGVETGNRHFPLGMVFMNGPTRGKDVFVPLEYLIGGVKMAGKGWRMLVECLSAGRGISLPALGTAAGKHSFLTTSAYAKVRKQFNMPIGKFEGIQEALGRIGGNTYRLEANRQFTLAALESKSPSVVTAIAKYHLTELGRSAVNDAMDVHAGKAIMLGPKNYLAGAYQSIPVSITVEGANILTRTLMIFGQGAIRCHPYIQKEIQSANTSDPKRALLEFDEAFFGHMGYIIKNFSKLLVHSFSGGFLLSRSASGRNAKYYRHIERMSIALSCVSEISMTTLGGKLKRLEMLSGRLGDVLSNLFMAAGIIKYFEHYGSNVEEAKYVDWGVQDCLYKCQESLVGVFENYPIPYIGGVLKFLIFPFSLPFKKPNDDLLRSISEDMLIDTKLRQRFKKLCFIDNNASDLYGRGETAFILANKLSPLFKRISEAKKEGRISKTLSFSEQVAIALEMQIINKEDAVSLNEYDALHLDVVNVDEFVSNLNESSKHSDVQYEALV